MIKIFALLGALSGTILSPSSSYAGDHPSSFLCTFENGHQFVFSNFDQKTDGAIYQSAELGWEVAVTMLDNGVKIDFLEKNQTDNGFIVTIDYFHKKNSEFFAVYSSVSPNPDNKFASSSQLTGKCK